MSQSYNGWTNYETWCVNLWLTNDEGSDSYWREEAATIKEDAADHPNVVSGFYTQEEEASHTLADRLKDSLEESMPEVDGMWSDLLRSSLSEVNYLEIAKAFLEE